MWGVSVPDLKEYKFFDQFDDADFEVFTEPPPIEMPDFGVLARRLNVLVDLRVKPADMRSAISFCVLRCHQKRPCIFHYRKDARACFVTHNFEVVVCAMNETCTDLYRGAFYSQPTDYRWALEEIPF